MARYGEAVGTCPVCQGDIVELLDLRFASLCPPIIGPGSRNQYRELMTGYACAQCGISIAMLTERTAKPDVLDRMHADGEEQLQLFTSRLNDLLKPYLVITTIEAKAWLNYVLGTVATPPLRPLPEGGSENPPRKADRNLDYDLAAVFASNGVNWRRAPEGAAKRLHEVLKGLLQSVSVECPIDVSSFFGEELFAEQVENRRRC